MTIFGGDRDPLTFDEAWNHPDQIERQGWREGIKNKFANMNRRGVWHQMKKSSFPRDGRLIGCKWVFKKKKNLVYRKTCSSGIQSNS